MVNAQYVFERLWLQKRFGVERSTSTVRRWLGKLGAVLTVGRPRHPKSSQRERHEFRHGLARKMVVARRDPAAVHLVVWDGAGFHPENGAPRVPENVVVLRQPPYSPELNPVEKLWDMLRDALCSRQWAYLDDLLGAQPG